MPNGKNGPKRGRTADLYTASVALYQLSYRPLRTFVTFYFSVTVIRRVTLRGHKVNGNR